LLGKQLKANEIKRACCEYSWEEQEKMFSIFFLNGTISIFEDFVERLASLIAGEDEIRRIYKDLQYPSQSGKGYLRAYSRFGDPISYLKDVFNAPFVVNRWYSGGRVQELLYCYRFFKEIRNAFAHNGGRATDLVVGAYNAFAPHATEAGLGVRVVPEHTVPVKGEEIEVRLRGIYGFNDVVLRLIATYDVDLSNRETAKNELLRRLKRLEAHNRARLGVEKQEKKIQGMLSTAGFPRANLTPEFRAFLKANEYVPDYWD